MKNIRLAAVSMSAIALAVLYAAMCVAIGGMAAAAPARAQDTASQLQKIDTAQERQEINDALTKKLTGALAGAKTAGIYGHANDVLGLPIANARVVLTTDNGKTARYTFTTDADGNYTGTGIKPGTYDVLLYGNVKDKSGNIVQGIIGYHRKFPFSAGNPTKAWFNLSDPNYIRTLPPARQAQIAEERKAMAAGAVPVAAPAFVPGPVPAGESAKIHGHAQDPLGLPVANAKVEITTNGKTPLYTFPTDASGNYTGAGIRPGTYIVLLYGNVMGKDGKMTQGAIDYQNNVKFTAHGDTQVDFDMTRQAYISKLSPEAQKQIAATRKSNAAALQANGKIKNVNKLIVDARAARKAGNFDQAIALDTQATQGKPDSGLTWYELGDSDLAAKKYDDAVTNYKKALAIMATDKTPVPAVLAAANNNLGEALAHSGKVSDAVVAYEAAAKADPTQAAKYYGNEAIVLYKTNQMDGAIAAADKAIAANPNEPTPYYIKGQALVQQSTVDPKTNKIVMPPGCADAYRKFLELEPSGPLADNVRSILEQAGEKVQTSYRKH